jgi:hypothetical protein
MLGSPQTAQCYNPCLLITRSLVHFARPDVSIEAQTNYCNWLLITNTESVDMMEFILTTCFSTLSTHCLLLCNLFEAITCLWSYSNDLLWGIRHSKQNSTKLCFLCPLLAYSLEMCTMSQKCSSPLIHLTLLWNEMEEKQHGLRKLSEYCINYIHIV